MSLPRGESAPEQGDAKVLAVMRPNLRLQIKLALREALPGASGELGNLAAQIEMACFAACPPGAIAKHHGCAGRIIKALPGSYQDFLRANLAGQIPYEEGFVGGFPNKSLAAVLADGDVLCAPVVSRAMIAHMVASTRGGPDPEAAAPPTSEGAAVEELSSLRSGVRTLVTMGLRKTLPGRGDRELADLAAGIERACYAAAEKAEGEDARPSGGRRAEYAACYSGILKALPNHYGDYLEATLAAQLLDGRVSCAEAARAEVYEAHLHVEPRQRVVARFYGILAKDPRFDDARRRECSTQIERGCFNASIVRCSESADSYRRQWDSPMFVAVYSARCGIVAANLDSAGTVILGVGSAWALDKLALGEWAPEDLGAKSEAELCPQAGKDDREQVGLRINQKVDKTTSSLFKCPRCHKRNCTYRVVQIGSGDEPSTFMCTCMECGDNYEGRA